MKTAAGWLIEQTEKLITIETFQQWKALKEQARKMEREQHGETWNDAIIAFKDRGFVESRAICDFDEYYEVYLCNRQL
jgi:hypothetical protein